MRVQHFFKYLVIVAVSFTACKKSDDGQSAPQVKKGIFSGYAQKGPFANGSSVTILELKKDLDQTGKTYFTTISDNLGNFEQKNIELISRYIALKADGFYFNEVSGQTSDAPITLYALADIEDVNSANVNVLTHLEKPRVEYLVQQEKMSFSAAKKQAQREVLAMFGFESEETSFETLDLTVDAKLLAISCILQGYLSTGDMMELMSNITTDIKKDGKLDNIALGSKLINNAFSVNISISAIRNNLTKKYTEMGINITIPDFESYIKSFVNSELYPQTVSIKYPATGLFGVNILSDETTEVNLVNGGSGMGQLFVGSMRAEVPSGLNLKIVLSGGTWYYEMSPNAPINWTISDYHDNTQSQEFTATESGKMSDLKFIFNYYEYYQNIPPYIIIEYYENGATTPTKIKRLYLNKP